MYIHYVMTNHNLDDMTELTDDFDNDAIFRQGIDTNCAAPITNINDTKQINSSAIEALHWENQQIGLYSCLATFVIFGSSSTFSTYFRCYMLLIVPGLFAGRGRALLMTISVGLLLDGPIASLNTNIQLVTKAFVCMYEQMKVLACRYKSSYSTIFDNVISTLRRIHEETERKLTEIANQAADQARGVKEKAEKARDEMKAELSKLKEVIDKAKRILNAPQYGCKGVMKGLSSVLSLGGLLPRPPAEKACGVNIIPDVSADVPNFNMDQLVEWTRKLFPNMDPLDINTISVGDLLQNQSLGNIKDKLISATQRFFDILEWVFARIKIGFYLLSIFYMLFQANRYLVKYLSNDSFDNMFVNETLDDGFREKLLPLRNWELKEKYQMTSTKRCVKLSHKEYQRIGLLVTPSLLFTLTTIGIIVADHLFASFIDVLKEHGKFGISFNGMEQGIELNGLLTEVANDGEIPILSLKLDAFDLSTDPCLPVPVKTDWKQLAPLIALVGISLISCFVDAYMQRLRSKRIIFYN